MAEESLFECKECGLHYKDQETAKQCAEWCRENKSCNLIITKESVESSLETS